MKHITSSKNSPSTHGTENPSRRRGPKSPPPPKPGSFLAWMMKFEDGWDTFRLAGSK